MLDPDMTEQELRLHLGELEANELLVARAAIRWANSAWTGRLDADPLGIGRLHEENMQLRGLLGKSQGDCVYCGLKAADMAKCTRGFPGCPRMDDIMTAVDTAIETRLSNQLFDMAEQRSKHLAALSSAQEALAVAQVVIAAALGYNR